MQLNGSCAQNGGSSQKKEKYEEIRERKDWGTTVRV